MPTSDSRSPKVMLSASIAAVIEESRMLTLVADRWSMNLRRSKQTPKNSKRWAGKHVLPAFLLMRTLSSKKSDRLIMKDQTALRRSVKAANMSSKYW